MRTTSRPLVFVWVCLGLLTSAGGHAATVQGSLWMSRETKASTARTMDPARIARAQVGIVDAVIWVDRIPDKVEQKLAGQTGMWFWKRPRPRSVSSIRQVDQGFRPRITVVPKGTRVEFHNADHVYHSTFSVSPAKRFDLGKYPPGKRDTVEFSQRGVINLHSDLFPEMMGFVVVTPNHAYARPDSLGRFTLPKLPAGRYTLRAWHPVRGELKREVEVAKHGDTVVDLRF